MGRPRDTNEELNRDRNFEHEKHDKTVGKKRDAEGRTNPKTISGTDAAQRDIENDGGAHGRNNGADKSGR